MFVVKSLGFKKICCSTFEAHTAFIKAFFKLLF